MPRYRGTRLWVPRYWGNGVQGYRGTVVIHGVAAYLGTEVSRGARVPGYSRVPYRVPVHTGTKVHRGYQGTGEPETQGSR